MESIANRAFLSLLLMAQLAVIASSQRPGPSPAPSSPQAPAKREDDVVRITTNLVQVDAVVMEKGKAVTDLKPEEVEIFEDGKRQKITNFSYIVTETPAEASATTGTKSAEVVAPTVPSRPRPENIRRTIAIVVDDLGLSFQSIHFVRRALKKYVEEQIQSGDLVAIVRTSGGMGAMQQFTTDRRQLLASIERIRWYGIGRSGVTAFAPMELPTEGDQGPAIDAANEELDRFRDDLFAVGTLGAVSYVVNGLREMPGRKSILLVSDGFRISSRDDPTRNVRALERLKRLIDEAGRASVVVYTMNARGVEYTGLTAADATSGMTPDQVEQRLSDRRLGAFETQEGLDYLAEETGGLAIRNTNDLNAGIRRVIEDQRGYYLIGYRPDESTFDLKTGQRTFHRLSVKVTRPGKFKVRTRNGFFGISEEQRFTAQKTGEQQLVGALLSPFGSSGVHLQLTSLFANQPNGSFMRSLLFIDARDLTFAKTEGMNKAVIDVVVVTFGDNGVPVDQSNWTYALRLSDEILQTALRDGFIYTATVPIKKPGAYQLRVAVRDVVSGRVGSAGQFVEVPDIKKNRLAMSGLVMNGMDIATFRRLTGGTQAKPDDANSREAEREDPQANTVVRRFRREMALQFGYVIYNAQLEKASGKPRLLTQVRLFRDGKLVFTGKETEFPLGNFLDPKRLPATGAIQLGSDMTPGEYVLQVIVTDLLADKKRRTATQSMDFELVK